jgi:HEAT repeat protein
VSTFRSLLLVWLATAPPALAQLDLPDQMRAARRGTSGPQKSGLILPPARPEPGGAEAAPGPATPAPTEAPPAPAPDDLVGRAAAVLDRLRGRDLYDPLESRTAAAELEALGQAGEQAARATLTLDHPSTLVAGVRVLLRRGTAEDRQRIGARLTGHLDRALGQVLLEAIAETDPTFLDDGRLVALLDHDQGTMRAAAERLLGQRSRGALLPALLPALGSNRADTRQRALELIAGVQDAAAVPLLEDRLGDASARVARRAVELLAAHPSPEVDRSLLQRLGSARALDRGRAYVLLALVEREDRSGRAILDPALVEPLLEGLRTGDPLVRGACATALAGIGFRSTSRDGTPWLDREVPHQLVGAVVGDQFHDHFSALQEPARRRLSHLSGERFGADGPAWSGWWVREAEHFRARRAHLEVGPGDEESVALTFRGTLAGGEAFALVGPAAAEPRGLLGEVVYLGAEEARALVLELGRLGLFTVERLPGQFGSGGGLRTLELDIAGQQKRIAFAGTATEPWFDSLLETARELRDQNRWQRYFDPARFASRRAFWAAERPWWIEPRSEAQRLQRTKELVLAALGGARSGDRDRLVEELEQLCAASAAQGAGALQESDFAPLLDVLRNELYFGPRAERLTRLALATRGDGPLDLAPARSLFDLLYELFHETAAGGLRDVVTAADLALAAALAEDSRPLARALAAPRLARSDRPEDRAVLRRLLEDEVELVQAAAVEAVGEAELGEFSTDVLVRARIAPPLVRSAALRAAGRVGGEGARDALIAGLGNADAELQGAAVAGLAALRDPATASILLSFVRRGPDSVHYQVARQGLLELGSAAWPDLEQLARAERLDLRREAGLLLAEQGAPSAAPPLIDVLIADPRDTRAAEELAVLTCTDLRANDDPGRAYAAWWQRTVQDDALAWFRGGQERAGIDAAPLGSLEGAGSRQGALSLLATLGLETEPILRERALRELRRLLERPELIPPATADQRGAWLEELRALIERRYP